MSILLIVRRLIPVSAETRAFLVLPALRCVVGFLAIAVHRNTWNRSPEVSGSRIIRQDSLHAVVLRCTETLQPMSQLVTS